ncbi:plant intracellular Ras-group-related LRR protein 4-like isoform X2 [Durio zibethinus]|nr:plant intracellular Ras-group-related LRR protein 4-like isoform X2 [Durio zibethinus]XP_022740489.1 plant intracellular Ras-group-related LRR protein 4-like isoform X2 [Durio zibethinus]
MVESCVVHSIDEAVEEIMRIHRSLPPRPALDEVEAAKALIRNVEKEDQARLDAIGRQSKNPDVPEELFILLLEMQKNLVYFLSKEKKREALKLLDLETIHALFDEFIQRASNCLSSSSLKSRDRPTHSNTLPHTTAPPPSNNSPAAATSSSASREPTSELVLFTRDDSYVKKAKSSFYANANDGFGISISSTPHILDSSLKSGGTTAAVHDDGKFSLIKLASLIEVSSKKGTRDLNLQSKLMDQIDWLPDSIGKLSSLITLDLSDNRIVALPDTIGGLSSLKKLDLHSNRIAQLPDSIGDLLCLVFLDLSANQLSTLPTTFGRLVRLEELDLSSNHLPSLPDSIGSLISLKKMNVETNDIDEIPHTIGRCTSLKELHADYNRLKALPEAAGKIETLEVLSVRYNNIKQLPTTMSSLANLKELDVSFNEVESVPESLCFATTLVKMNIGNNFADLRSLPRSIGNLEMLEELDISNNQIRVLPDSFRMLTRLQVLRVEENPLEVPPRHIAEQGAQAVVRYMVDLVEKKDVKSETMKQKKSWAQICFFSRSNKRKRNGMDYLKA